MTDDPKPPVDDEEQDTKLPDPDLPQDDDTPKNDEAPE